MVFVTEGVEVNLTTNELACIDAEMESAGYNISYQMIDVVTAYIIVRCMRAMSYTGAPKTLSNLTAEIADYFSIPSGLARAIQTAIYSNMPECLKSVTKSVDWNIGNGVERVYENPEY